MMKKYELLTAGAVRLGARKLYLVRALRDFGDVRCGDIGGRVEQETNLSQNGNAWVGGHAWVYGESRICGDQVVAGHEVVRDGIRVPLLRAGGPGLLGLKLE
jgi:hypothetical protein